MSRAVHVVGGGLAGSECAWQLASHGQEVVLWEMRPAVETPAHRTGRLAELVCSNSLRSDDPHHPSGLLKREMEVFGSLVLRAAREQAVPAGSALAVDRERFAAVVSECLERHPRVEVRREELKELPAGEVVIASGPLTSPDLSRRLGELLGSEHLYFYDAISPVVEAESLDHTRLFAASRYGKGGGDDYLNAPMDRDGYVAFREAVLRAEVLPLREFERALFFEGCLPIEELARRGEDTLRFGPMKPVGLRPPTGERPYAVVQLRQENLARSQYSLVGFQSRLRWPDQRRVLRLIPGLEQAQFVRLGQVHRNTFVNSPVHLDRLYRLKLEPRVRLAGQITGVEGYLESAATGLAAALYMILERRGREVSPLPATTALGALARHLTESDPCRFQPANVNYGLFPPLPERVSRRGRRAAFAARSACDLAAWASSHGLATQPDVAALRAG
ncbi:MAG TPA: methylenetetrahydrofolate--tRNA-(uracil(54)-C(5))-methyltransferase (FADH(2)-oxidizing) TrmFO [Thermoanaerobaculia bacterium]|nr:methylenetetrahydrofolate--tRNA-(uracil(54)-C(5))-methyltransferase (FADH(2)-oxidizing) TrmFO [Thermoanaerobaculia bacterium]